MRARSHVCRLTLVCLLVGVWSLRLDATAVPRTNTAMSAVVGDAGTNILIIRCARQGGRSHAHQAPILAAARDAALAQRLRLYPHVAPGQPAPPRGRSRLHRTPRPSRRSNP